MTYVGNTPVSGQSLGNSRPIINANFTTIQTVYDANHVDFNAMNAGAHTHVDLLAQGSDPGPATGLVSHYSKAVSTTTEWFFQRENSGSVIQMSAGTPTIIGSYPNTFGSTFLPGGLIAQWGRYVVSNSASGNATVTFAGVGLQNFPNAALFNLVSVNAPSSSMPQITVSTLNMTTTSIQFQWVSTTALSYNIFWLAIGN